MNPQVFAPTSDGLAAMARLEGNSETRLVVKRGSITAAAAGFTAFLNIYAVQPLLPTLSHQFQADSSTVSLSVSATTLAVALAAPFTSSLVSRWTRSRLIKVAVGGLVFSGLQVALAQSLKMLIFWRFAQGLFLPLLIAAVLAFMAEDFPKSQISRATSLYVSWSIAGGFCGRWLAGWVAGGFGWRAALLILALANAGAGAVLYKSLMKPDARLRVQGRRLLAFTILARSSVRDICLLGLGTLFTLVGLFTYITFHLASAPFCLGPEELGRTFCVYLLGIIVTPMVGEVLARVGVGRLILGATMCASMGLCLTLVPRLGSVMLGLTFVCVAAFATQAAASSFIAKLGPEEKAGAAGLYLSFYYFGGCLGAILPGWAWSLTGWTGCVALLVVVQLGMGALSLRVSAEKNLRICSNEEGEHRE